MFIDVNGLHEINNSAGHDAGDKMLCAIADLCKKYFANHSIFRMGGDESLILCENVEEKDILITVQKLFDAVEQAGYSISYGVELQESYFNLNEIVKNADEKMIHFKKEYYNLANCRKR